MSSENRLTREPWASALKKAGFVNPRTGEPSMSSLAREAGVHISTLTKIVNGTTRSPETDTVTKVADALEVPFVTVAQWIGLAWTDTEPYEPPKESALLNARERLAVTEIIRCMVAERTLRET